MTPVPVGDFLRNRAFRYRESKTRPFELRLRNQDAQVAKGGESNRLNVDVRLHQRSALSQFLFLILMDVLTDGVRI